MQSLIKSVNFIIDRMATKDDLLGMATKEDLLGMATKEDLFELRQEMATKNELEKVRLDILEAIRPTEKAVDKDAVTILDHGKRISRIERHLALK